MIAPKKVFFCTRDRPSEPEEKHERQKTLLCPGAAMSTVLALGLVGEGQFKDFLAVRANSTSAKFKGERQMQKMKIKVTSRDIDAGDGWISEKCGCPIWQAINRILGLGLDPMNPNMALLKFTDTTTARIGKNLVFHFPQKAIEWQLNGMNNRDLALKPIAFEAKLEVRS